MLPQERLRKLHVELFESVGEGSQAALTTQIPSAPPAQMEGVSSSVLKCPEMSEMSYSVGRTANQQMRALGRFSELAGVDQSRSRLVTRPAPVCEVCAYGSRLNISACED
jgi:hypothetical protein